MVTRKKNSAVPAKKNTKREDSIRDTPLVRASRSSRGAVSKLSEKTPLVAIESDVETVSSEDHTGYDNIASSLDRYQKGASSAVVEAQELLEQFKKDNSQFCENLRDALMHVLIISTKNNVATTIVDFLGRDVISQDKTLARMFLKTLCNFLLDSSNRFVRMRSFQLLAAILDTMYQSQSYWEGFVSNSNSSPRKNRKQCKNEWQDISTVVLEKILAGIEDKIAAVRAEAVRALVPFSHNSPEICDILTKVMSTDTSTDVRTSAVKNSLVFVENIQSFVDRTRDIHPEVRAAVYELFRDDVNPQELSISQRVEILSRGLSDSSVKVKNAAIELMNTWFNSTQGQTLKFLRMLDLEFYPRQAEAIIPVFIEHTETQIYTEFLPSVQHFLDQDSQTVPLEDLYNIALLLNNVLHHYRVNGENEKIEKLLPEHNNYMNLIHNMWVRLLENEFQFTINTFKQILKLGLQLDHHNEGGIRNIATQFKAMLICQEDEKQNYILQLIPDFVNYCVTHRQCNSLLDMYRSLTSFGSEDELQFKKSMILAVHALEVVDDLSTGSPMHDLLRELSVEPFLVNLGHESSEIRSLCLRFSCLYSILNNQEQIAQSQLPILSEFISHDSEDVVLVAIKCAFDLSIAFGSFISHEVFTNKEHVEYLLFQQLKEFIAINVKNDEESREERNLEVEQLVIEGFSKLLLHGRMEIETAHNVLVLLLRRCFNSDVIVENEDIDPFFVGFLSNFCEMQSNGKLMLINSFTGVAEFILSQGGEETEEGVAILVQFIVYLIGDKNSDDDKRGISDQLPDCVQSLSFLERFFVEFCCFFLSSRRELLDAWKVMMEIPYQPSVQLATLFEVILEESTELTSGIRRQLSSRHSKLEDEQPQTSEAKELRNEMLRWLETRVNEISAKNKNFFKKPLHSRKRRVRSKTAKYVVDSSDDGDNQHSEEIVGEEGTLDSSPTSAPIVFKKSPKKKQALCTNCKESSSSDIAESADLCISDDEFEYMY